MQLAPHLFASPALVLLVALTSCRTANQETDAFGSPAAPAASAPVPTSTDETATPTPTVNVEPPGTVPWNDRADFAHWQPPLEQRDEARACTSADLRVMPLRRDQGNDGRLRVTVAVFTRSPGLCTLTGYPAIEGTTASGSRELVPTEQDPSAPHLGGETPATIDPMESAVFVITTGPAEGSTDCRGLGSATPGPERSWSELDFVLPDSSHLHVPGGLTATCTSTVTRFYRQAGYATEPPDRWPDLRARLVLPEVVHPGEVVEYRVTVRNTGADAVDLRPCGGYHQEVQVLGAGYAAEAIDGGRTELRLNCDGDPVLRPGQSRTYAMELRLPDELKGPEVLFRWGFVDNLPDYDAQQWVELVDP